MQKEKIEDGFKDFKNDFLVRGPKLEVGTQFWLLF